MQGRLLVSQGQVVSIAPGLKSQKFLRRFFQKAASSRAKNPNGPARRRTDQIEMTQEGVAAVRRYTLAYEIVLLDNGSASAQAEVVTASQENFPDTQVLRIVEAFNYARLNNPGANLSDREFLLFLNNDVIVEKSSWIRLMIGECLADEKVGAVGCKLLCPNQKHAGWCWARAKAPTMRFAASAATRRVM